MVIAGQKAYRTSIRKKKASPDEHIMNQDEAKLLRRIQSETGLSEKEIRQKKK